MKKSLNDINFREVEYIYKSPHSLVDYSKMQSFSLIKSSIEVFAYYGIDQFSPSEIKAFFEKLELINAKSNKVFIPSLKKIRGVLECCVDSNARNYLSEDGDHFRIVHWDHDGYRYEIELAYMKKYI